ncbi:hypothetical protein DFJ73DRAFT_795411 [Zopfochytrium polystomum]|nr:hypothetical protein DFJ73DRAFT_795411 [Zopfochytrium polystomum]
MTMPPLDDHIYLTGVESEHVVAVSKADGAIVWRAVVQGANKIHHYSNALLAHPPTGNIIAVVGKQFVAFDARTGAIAWKPAEPKKNGGRPTATTETGILADQAVESAWYTSEAGKDDEASFLRNLVVCAVNCQVNGLRLSDGIEQWNFFHRDLGGNPTVLLEDGVLYVGGLGVLFALNALNGKQIWASRIPDVIVQLHIASMRSSPLYRPRYCDPTSQHPGTVPAIFSQSESKKAGSGDGPTAQADRLVVVARREVFQVDPATGQDLPGAPKFDLGYRVPGSQHTGIYPFPTTGRALVWAGAMLRLFDMLSGDIVWLKMIPSVEGYTPNVHVGPGAGSGLAVCLDPRSGEIRWQRKLTNGARFTSVATFGAGNGEANRSPELGPVLAARLLVNS